MANGDVKRIRTGLRFLTKADTAIIRSAVILEKLDGDPHPQGPNQLLKRRTFRVDSATFKGRMTNEQFQYLNGCTTSIAAFADAISRLLLRMDPRVVDALLDLSSAMDVPQGGPATAILPGGIDPPAYGCCIYDNTKADAVTETFCLAGLLGTSWVQGPCIGRP